MVASSDQCRRHASGSASAIPSFSDDGVVHTVLKEIQKAVKDKHPPGEKPYLVRPEGVFRWLDCVSAVTTGPRRGNARPNDDHRERSD